MYHSKEEMDKLLRRLNLTPEQRRELDAILDGGRLVIEHDIECWNCGYKQEDTQRFCVECSQVLS